MSRDNKRILEVIVTSVEEAILAEQGGADRLELIRDFSVGGLTPPLRLVSNVIDRVKIPMRVIVRDQANFRVNNDSEIKDLREILASLASMKIDGVVLGLIREGTIDTRIISTLLQGHDKLKVTFHRAFEATNDPVESIRALQNFPQIDKILTNGGGTNWGSSSWDQRIERIQSWQQIAKPIGILVGGEVDSNALQLLRETEIREFHVGRSVRTPETTSGKIDITKIEKMRFILD